MVYEGARSVNGPYLKTLGANAAMVGLVAGFAEFLGMAYVYFQGILLIRLRRIGYLLS